MKTLISLILLTSLQSFANEIENYDRSDLSPKEVIEMIYKEAWEVYTGDDGKECNSSTFDYKYLENDKANTFSIIFNADQNGEYDYGCLVGVFPCQATFNIEKSKWKVDVTCDLY